MCDPITEWNFKFFRSKWNTLFGDTLVRLLIQTLYKYIPQNP